MSEPAPAARVASTGVLVRQCSLAWWLSASAGGAIDRCPESWRRGDTARGPALASLTSASDMAKVAPTIVRMLPKPCVQLGEGDERCGPCGPSVMRDQQAQGSHERQRSPAAVVLLGHAQMLALWTVQVCRGTAATGCMCMQMAAAVSGAHLQIVLHTVVNHQKLPTKQLLQARQHLLLRMHIGLLWGRRLPPLLDKRIRAPIHELCEVSVHHSHTAAHMHAASADILDGQPADNAAQMPLCCEATCGRWSPARLQFSSFSPAVVQRTMQPFLRQQAVKKVEAVRVVARKMPEGQGTSMQQRTCQHSFCRPSPYLM